MFPPTIVMYQNQEIKQFFLPSEKTTTRVLKIKVLFSFPFEFILQLKILLKHPKPSEHLAKHHWLQEHMRAEPWYARAESSEQAQSHGSRKTKWVCFNTNTRKKPLKSPQRTNILHSEPAVLSVDVLICSSDSFLGTGCTEHFCRKRCLEFLTQQLMSDRALQNAFNIWITQGWASDRRTKALTFGWVLLQCIRSGKDLGQGQGKKRQKKNKDC